MFFFQNQDFAKFGIRIAVSMVCGTLLGAERQWRGRHAGLRTNVLVCVGATIFSYLSSEKFISTADASRVAAQIVSGVGFLGAGVIMRRDDGIQGLNTATTIWAAAALGMAAGLGAFPVAILSTMALLAVQTLYRPLSASIDSLAARNEPRFLYHFTAVSDIATSETIREQVQSAILERRLDCVSSKITTQTDGFVLAQYGILAPPSLISTLEPIWHSLLQLPGVRDVSWHKENPAKSLSRLLHRKPRPERKFACELR